jgi:hypothetical protein
MAFEENNKMACSEVVGQREEIDVKKVAEVCRTLSGEEKMSGKGLICCQVGNEKGSVDLVNYQVGRGDIPNFQVGKGGEMVSVESSC